MEEKEPEGLFQRAFLSKIKQIFKHFFSRHVGATGFFIDHNNAQRQAFCGLGMNFGYLDKRKPGVADPAQGLFYGACVYGTQPFFLISYLPLSTVVR